MLYAGKNAEAEFGEQLLFDLLKIDKLAGDLVGVEKFGRRNDLAETLAKGALACGNSPGNPYRRHSIFPYHAVYTWVLNLLAHRVDPTGFRRVGAKRHCHCHTRLQSRRGCPLSIQINLSELRKRIYLGDFIFSYGD